MLTPVREKLEELSCSSKEKHQIEVSVEEALVNIINYAYPEKRGEIEILCSLPKPGLIEITIKDWGAAFNPETFVKSVEKDLPLEDRKVGGLGVYFMYQLMDQISYRREEGANILTLSKRVA